LTRAEGLVGNGVTTTGAGEDVAALTLDQHGMICDCNCATEALFRYRRNEIVQRHISTLLPQLGQLDLMEDGRINQRLHFLCHIGHTFQAVPQDGECFDGELFLNIADNMTGGFVSVIVRPVDEPTTGGERHSA